MNFLKRTLPLAIAFFFGILAIALYYIPHQIAADLTKWLNKSTIIIVAVAAFLGSYSLLMLHYGKIKRRTAGWGYSILTFIGFAITTGFALYNGGKGFLNPRVSGDGVEWMYSYVYSPCQSTMYSLLAFFIASAAFRSFRAKTAEASLLLTAALVVMFGQVPISNLISPRIPEFAQWLLAVPGMAVKRAILFGVCVGAVGTSLRVIFGIERAYLGGE